MRIPILPLLAATVAFAASMNGQSTVTTAVLDFETGDQRSQAAGGQFSALLSANLASFPELEMVERQALETVLSESELGLTGAISNETAAKLGHMVGAKALVLGKVFPTGPKTTTVVAKVMGVETGRVFPVTSSFATAEGSEASTQQLAEMVIGVIRANPDAFTVKATSDNEIIDRLKKVVEGKQLPTVAVEIPEQHISRPIPDPAAETEIKLILSKVGFEVIDEADGDRKADILIKGEAFSEMGMRKGNLFACRARVEVKVTPRNGQIASQVDRETASGIDLSENIAAKNALQKAGANLAERLVPMLAGS